MDPVLEWLLGELERTAKKLEKDSADAWRNVSSMDDLALADIEAVQGGVEALHELVREARQRIKEGRVAATWKERLKAEREELSERLARLSEFKGTPIFKSLMDVEKYLLYRQHDIMAGYLEVLDLRLELSRRPAV